MRMAEIQDYARQLMGAYGDKARAIGKRRWKARSVASHMKLRIGGAFVTPSRRCGARISANW